jgi:hypothetical protein
VIRTLWDFLIPFLTINPVKISTIPGSVEGITG